MMRHRKTHCIRGHSLDDAYVARSGKRDCRQCLTERVRQQARDGKRKSGRYIRKDTKE